MTDEEIAAIVVALRLRERDLPAPPATSPKMPRWRAAGRSYGNDGP
jgi:hypothetical protein